MDRKRTALYFKRNLGLLPQAYTEYDSSLTSLIFFSLAGLSLMGEIGNLPSSERGQLIAWTYQHLVDNGDGFRGSLTHKTGNDPATLTSTYFCLCILGLLEDTTMRKKLNRQKMLDYVVKCQAKDGKLYSMYDKKAGGLAGESDPRTLYTGCSIVSILGAFNPLDIEKAINTIESSLSYDGGLSYDSMGESHAGYTYCNIASWKMLKNRPWDNKHTYQWLSRRQLTQENGGFNGRVNKDADTCYSFWNTASLAIADKLNLIDCEAGAQFLITQSQSPLGGFSKDKGSYPDPLHSYLALCALSIMDHDKYGLKPLDPILCLPRETVAFFKVGWN